MLSIDCQINCCETLFFPSSTPLFLVCLFSASDSGTCARGLLYQRLIILLLYIILLFDIILFAIVLYMYGNLIFNAAFSQVISQSWPDITLLDDKTKGKNFGNTIAVLTFIKDSLLNYKLIIEHAEELWKHPKFSLHPDLHNLSSQIKVVHDTASVIAW